MEASQVSLKFHHLFQKHNIKLEGLPASLVKVKRTPSHQSHQILALEERPAFKAWAHTISTPKLIIEDTV